MPSDESDVAAGARNLLLNCAQARPGESLLLIRERPDLGIYGTGLIEAVAASAVKLGLRVAVREVAFSPTVEELPGDLAEMLIAADHAVFFARLGDQLRFRAMPKGARPIVSYTLDTDMLGSCFGTTDYRAFVALKKALDRTLSRASDIHVTCPLGTDLRGSARPVPAEEPADTSVLRFPMSVFSPLPARAFTGRVAVARFLVGTGSNYYEPYGLPLAQTIFAEVADGRILRFCGPVEEVQSAYRHYEHVGRLFAIDPYALHSWHAGIHPGCCYPMPAEANFERWSCGAFGNPRILHFHTCGNYAPGEICWNVIDATIACDGLPVLSAGILKLEHIETAGAIIESHLGLSAVFEHPEQEIGL